MLTAVWPALGAPQNFDDSPLKCRLRVFIAAHSDPFPGLGLRHQDGSTADAPSTAAVFVSVDDVDDDFHRDTMEGLEARINTTSVLPAKGA